MPPVDARVLLAHARADLTGRVASPAVDARLLLAHVLQVPPARLITAPAPTEDQAHRFRELVTTRRTGVPLQHLTGSAAFRHLELAVGPGVFIPRPETEAMVEWCLTILEESSAPLVVDLCTGSGAIALSLAQELAPGAEVHAVEKSPEALEWTRRNCAHSSVVLHEGDAVDPLPELDGRVDLVVCNPPYIPLSAWESVPAEVRDHDPVMALFSGQDGLDLMRALPAVAARLLRPHGWVAVEHADSQGEQVVDLFVRHGAWTAVADHHDLTGRPRFVTAQRSEAGWAL